MTYTETDLDQATAAYIETMLWASCPMSEDGDRSFADANYASEDDCTDALVASCRADVKAFLDYIDAKGALDIIENEGMSYADLGHDFWLTRNGHGAGFWDGGYEVVLEYDRRDIYTGLVTTVETTLGAELTKASKVFGSGHCDLYLEGADEHGAGGLVTE